MRRVLERLGERPAAFLAPAAIVLGVVTFFPIVYVLWLSLARYSLIGDEPSFVGLDNFVRLASDARFWNALGNTLYFTLVSVARRLMIFIAVLGSIILAVEEVHLFDNWSTSVLASAGIVSVNLGVAAHNVLGNIMAGIQIALTQPARIGDSVVFEGHWGYIEDITYTSVTIRRWDAKRVIVPVSHFISQPFENWSMKESHILTTVVLYVDYGIDIDLLRTKVCDVLASSPAWDRQVGPSLQVTELKTHCMEVRVLCSAKDGPSAWDLQCHLREELIEFVRTLEEGRYLPKRRLLIDRPQDSRHAASSEAGDAAGRLPVSPPSCMGRSE